MVRFFTLATGHIVELDDSRRDPRLVGKTSWPSCHHEVPRDHFPDEGGQPPAWPDGSWSELVADCGCADCQVQRDSTLTRLPRPTGK